MERKPMIVSTMLVVFCLLVFNLGLRTSRYQESREISGYEYAKLHAAVNLTGDLIDTVNEELKHERVSIAEYNNVMRKIELFKLKQEARRAHSRNSAVAQASLSIQ